MHAPALVADLLGEISDRGGFVERAMAMIGKEGDGVIILLNRPMIGGNLFGSFEWTAADDGVDPDALRDYGIGAQILTELGVQDLVLLTNSHHALVALDGYGLSIVGERAIP